MQRLIPTVLAAALGLVLAACRDATEPPRRAIPRPALNLVSQITVTDLGTLGGDVSRAFAINALGQVAGTSTSASGAPRAFLWANGVMQDLGTLWDNGTEAIAINDLGQVAVNTTNRLGAEHAFLWASGTMQDLGTLGGPFSFATGINAAGQVIGLSNTASGQPFHAVLWTTPSFRPLTLALTQVQLKPTAAEKVQMQGSFTLDAASDGINPGSEPVPLELRKPDGTRVYPTTTNPYGVITGFDVTTTGWAINASERSRTGIQSLNILTTADPRTFTVQLVDVKTGLGVDDYSHLTAVLTIGNDQGSVAVTLRQQTSGGGWVFP